MKVWVTANQKGGVGKTTTAVSLAGLLSQRKQSTLLIDLDPHASLTAYFGYDPDELEHTAYDMFSDPKMDVEQCLLSTGFDHLKLIPGSLALATLDKRLNKLDGKGLIVKYVVNKLSDRFEHVVIDCPPVLGILMINALAACDHLLVPVQTEFLALKGLERMMRTLDMVTHAGKAQFDCTIVPTMFDRRTRASVQTLRKIRDDYRKTCWQAVVPIDTRLRDASKAHKPPCYFDEKSRAAVAYKRLLRDIEAGKDHMLKAM